MKIPFPTFANKFAADPQLLRQLDTCFDKALTQTGPYAVSNSYTFRDNDTVDSLQVDATSGNLVAILPSPTGNRRRRVVKMDAGANTVTVTASTGLINGTATYALRFQYEYVWLEPTGTNWLIIGSNTFGNAWSIVTAAAALDATRYVQGYVGGTSVKIAIVL